MSTVRQRRKQLQTGEREHSESTTTASQKVKESQGRDDQGRMSLWMLSRQYSGAILGTIATVGTVGTFEEQDPFMVHKITGWMIVASIALILHEFRPCKRTYDIE
eukprot:jgi/Picsp_1/1281/NSC_04762-R1_---NA---